MSKYDWVEIQRAYDEDELSLRDIRQKFGCCMAAMIKAVKRGDLKTRNKYDALKIAKRKKPHKHSEETKQKISKIRKKYLEDNPDKVPYLLNHYSKRMPYSEKYFIEVIEKEQLPLKYHLQVGLYELDFYNESIKFCLEVDGEQHYLDNRIVESDKRKNAYLENLGWHVERIRWSTYQKMKYNERVEYINYLRDKIDLLLRG